MNKSIRAALITAFLILASLSSGCDNTSNAALLLAQQPEEPITWSSPGSVTSHDSMQAYQGVTVFHDDAQQRIFAVRMDGTVVGVWKAWNEGFPLLSFAKPLDGGMLMLHPGFPPPGSSPIFPSREVAIIGLDGNPLWEWFGAPNLQIIHHEFFLLENGNVMVLVSPKPDTHFPDISPEVVQDDLILEIDPTTDEIVWSWSTAAHYSQLPFTAMQRTLMLDQTRIDVFHTNAFHVIPDNDIDHGMHPEFTPGNILVSQRQTNFVFIIDRATGNVVWNLDHDTIGNIGQHMIRMIPKGLPGAGNLLLFDNGCCAGLPVMTRTSSRVLEIEPVSQALVWSYDIGTDFYSEIRSGAQRLPNGNTLISASQDQRIFEVTSAGEVVWDYQQTAANGHYRAYRVDGGWLSGGDTGPVTPFPW